MTSIQKFQEMLADNKTVQKLGFGRALKTRQIMNEKYPFISSVNFGVLIDILGRLGFSETEKIEIIAFYYNKTLNFYNGEETNKQVFDFTIKQVMTKQLAIIPTYEEQCNKVELIRILIDENGTILPTNLELNAKSIEPFQDICSISKEYVIKMLKLSQKKYNDILKEDSIRKRGTEELFKKLFPDDVQDHYYSSSEIADIKNRMLKLGYSAEEIKQIIDNILETNEHIEQKSSKSFNKKTIVVDYKAMKELSYQLKQYIDDNDKPYDYMSEEQIEEVTQLLNKLNYTETRKNTILNNIRKTNAFIKQNEILEVQNQIKIEIFNEIDSRNDKPFTALSSETYEIAIKHETKIEDLNNRINAALAEIQNSIINLANSTEDKEFYIEYIMEALFEIDQCFSKATEWNLIKERKK